jgi:hypothetical protein
VDDEDDEDEDEDDDTVVESSQIVSVGETDTTDAASLAAAELIASESVG